MKRVMCLLLLTISSGFGQKLSVESGWKGIKVFETDRARVEAILGKPDSDVDKIHKVYSAGGRKVAVVYSDSPCTAELGEKGDFKLKKETVLDYRVSFETPFPLSELSWNKKRYTRSEDPHRLDVFVYDNPTNGVWITTGIVNGIEMVGSLGFRASDAQKRQFRCNPVE